jgi:cobalt-zinc-cadmium efflux system protein
MHDTAHNHGAQANARALTTAIFLTGGYLIAEVAGGILTGSLALLSDAGHMLTDVMALVIALVAVKLAQRPADAKRTFGYYRIEILAAAANASVLFLVAFYILYEAWQRFASPHEIHSTPMLIVAALGLVVNLAAMRVLHAGSKHSLNLKSAYVEVWSDLLGSIAVIAGAVIIRVTDWEQVDPILAVLIGLWVLPRSWTLIAESLNILLEGVPQGIELNRIEERLAAVSGVASVHDLHVWAITSGKNSLTAHLVLAENQDQQEILEKVSAVLSHDFGITHSTIQIEAVLCGPDDRDCALGESEHSHHHAPHTCGG